MYIQTITTFDQKNSAEYTTTDKLYLPMADGIGSSYTVLKAGTDQYYESAANHRSGKWYCQNSGSYDTDVRTAQTFTLKDAVTLPKMIANSNHIPLEVTLTVTVRAANIVVTPTAVPKDDTTSTASQAPLSNNNLKAPKTADTAGTVF